MDRRTILKILGLSPLVPSVYVPAAHSQALSSNFSLSQNLGDAINDLLGIGHPSQEINEAYFEAILANQERIISALGRIASSIQNAAEILELIPYQTNEIGETIRANSIFIRSQGLLSAIGNTIANGNDPRDQAFVDAFAGLVTDVDLSTARYSSAVATLGQSHDLCIAVRPLWNAIQSVRDAGDLVGALNPAFDELLNVSALRIRDTGDLILQGTGNQDNALGVFRSRYEAQLVRLDQAAERLRAYQPERAPNIHYFVFPFSSDFLRGTGPEELVGRVQINQTGFVTSCAHGGQEIESEFSDAMRLDCPAIEMVINSDSRDAKIVRLPFSPSQSHARLFKLEIDPFREQAVINSHIEAFNIEAAQFYHYASAESVVMEVVGEIEASLAQ